MRGASSPPPHGGLYGKLVRLGRTVHRTPTRWKLLLGSQALFTLYLIDHRRRQVEEAQRRMAHGAAPAEHPKVAFDRRLREDRGRDGR
mmetsp:Transcript_5730/g.12032  ORF Transcript_5730/g.12032 Transcript_5730/m.12032 type:complete len:88 (+) Transcript_5730:144-407(+)